MTSSAAGWDREFLWHPFTQMRDWMAGNPVVITRGQGAWLEDDQGRKYLDGNSSIWTNVHGHNVPELNEAITTQLGKIAHSSFLGLTNEIAPRLGRELLRHFLETEPEGSGRRVFFSDDGSTAVEAGLKMMHQARAQRGESERNEILSLSNAYHGDTIGAMSAGHSGAFHRVYKPWLFSTREVMSPACYRCPYNQAPPQRGSDARLSRRCQMECLDELKKSLDASPEKLSAFVLEPRVQGAGNMSMHPEGYLRDAARLCRERGVWLMLDEVFTGFGRTGRMFACQKEEVLPDVIALAKGLTGGYLPLAATICTKEIFDAFLGDFSELKTFFHGHSYTGNQLGSAVALANLALFEKQKTQGKINHIAEKLAAGAQRFWVHPNVGDIRQEGVMLAIELVEDFATRRSFDFKRRVGGKVCEEARKHGLMTRPSGDVLFLMPPACTTDSEIDQMLEALWRGLRDVLPS